MTARTANTHSRRHILVGRDSSQRRLHDRIRTRRLQADDRDRSDNKVPSWRVLFETPLDCNTHAHTNTHIHAHMRTDTHAHNYVPRILNFDIHRVLGSLWATAATRLSSFLRDTRSYINHSNSAMYTTLHCSTTVLLVFLEIPPLNLA